MTTDTKSREKRSGQVRLSSHDVNVISAIIQQKDALPRKFLLDKARSSRISNDAIEIVEILLDESFAPKVSSMSASPTRKSAAKQSIADEFYRWAVATKSY